MPCADDDTALTRSRPPATRNLCIVLSPSHEIKVFAEGVQTFSFRNARWHLLDLQAKYEMWEDAIGNPALSERLFQTACRSRGCDARERCSSCCAIRRSSLPQLVAPADQLDAVRHTGGTRADARTAAAHAAGTKRPRARSGRARRPGAHRWRNGDGSDGRLLAVGAILLHTEPPEPHSNLAVEGATNYGGDGGRTIRRGAEGQRGRADHVLRSAGTDLGYLNQLPASSFPASSFQLPAASCQRIYSP